MKKLLQFSLIHLDAILHVAIAICIFTLVGVAGAVEQGVLTIAKGAVAFLIISFVMISASLYSGAFYHHDEAV